MRRCVVYIQDPNTTLIFDLKVKFTEFLTCICVWPVTSVCFDSDLPFFTLTFCRAQSHYVWHMSVSPWYDVSRTFITFLWLWLLTWISKNIFTRTLSLARSSLFFNKGIPNFGIWVYHHETTYCVHSLPLYDLDLWPIFGWRGVSLVSFTYSLYLVFFCKVENYYRKTHLILHLDIVMFISLCNIGQIENT